MVKIKTQFKTIQLEKPNGEPAGEILVDLSDKNVKRLTKVVKELEAEANKQADGSEEEYKAFLIKTIDGIFGAGTFEMLYNLAPSLALTTVNFLAIAEEIEAEIEKDTRAIAKQKYLKKASKK